MSSSLKIELRDKEESLCLLQSGVGNFYLLNGVGIEFVEKSVTENMN